MLTWTFVLYSQGIWCIFSAKSAMTVFFFSFQNSLQNVCSVHKWYLIGQLHKIVMCKYRCVCYDITLVPKKCIYIYIHTYIHTHTHIYIYIHTYIHMTLNHKSSHKQHGYICNNSQQYIVWVKSIISFYYANKSLRY